MQSNVLLFELHDQSVIWTPWSKSLTCKMDQMHSAFQHKILSDCLDYSNYYLKYYKALETSDILISYINETRFPSWKKVQTLLNNKQWEWSMVKPRKHLSIFTITFTSDHLNYHLTHQQHFNLHCHCHVLSKVMDFKYHNTNIS